MGGAERAANHFALLIGCGLCEVSGLTFPFLWHLLNFSWNALHGCRLLTPWSLLGSHCALSVPPCWQLARVSSFLTSRELFSSLGKFFSECRAGVGPHFVGRLELVLQDQEDRPKAGLEVWQATSVHPHYPPGGTSQAGLKIEGNKTKVVLGPQRDVLWIHNL